jgi:hypothetical protein
MTFNHIVLATQSPLQKLGTADNIATGTVFLINGGQLL